MYNLCRGVNTRVGTARTSRFNRRICNATERQLQCLLDGGDITAFLSLPTVECTAIVLNPKGKPCSRLEPLTAEHLAPLPRLRSVAPPGAPAKEDAARGLGLSNLPREMSIVMPRSLSAASVSSTQAYLDSCLPAAAASSCTFSKSLGSSPPQVATRRPAVVLLPASTWPMTTRFRCGFWSARALTCVSVLPPAAAAVARVSGGGDERRRRWTSAWRARVGGVLGTCRACRGLAVATLARRLRLQHRPPRGAPRGPLQPIAGRAAQGLCLWRRLWLRAAAAERRARFGHEGEGGASHQCTLQVRSGALVKISVQPDAHALWPSNRVVVD